MHAHTLDRTAAGSPGRALWKTWVLWVSLWMVCFFGATIAFEVEALPAGLGYAAALANAVLGVIAVWSYFRLLRGVDELERKIQVEALALGFGAGAVGMMAYRLLERAGAPRLDINDALLVMLAAYGVGVLLARRRYA
jgi:hypothetical protein